jgi:hypothetical protein
LSDERTKRIIEELERDRNTSLLSTQSQQQNLEVKVKEVESKMSKLIDVYLEGSLSLEEYQAKKEDFINEKKKLQEALQDFAAGGNNWFEQAKDFVTSLNRAHCAIAEGNLESQKEFLEKIGSNFILKERRLVFSTGSPYRGFLLDAPYLTWRCSCDEIRMFYRHNFINL